MDSIASARAGARARIAALDADVLLVHALGVTKEFIYAHPERPLRPAERARFAELVRRRAAGEPVAYLRGSQEFYALDLAVDPRVLIPRPETETLVDEARAYVRRTGARTVADVGTGSGAVAVALAVNEPGLRLIATDVSTDALAVARANAERHGVADRIDLRAGDLLEPLREPVDVLVANLPYLRDRGASRDRYAALAHEPDLALFGGSDGLALIRRAVAGLPRVLRGAAFFELDPEQADEVAALLGALGEVRVLRDLAGLRRAVAVTLRRA